MTKLQRLILKMFRVELPVTPIQPVLKSATNLSLKEWRKTDGLVIDSKKLANHPILQMQIQVLRNEHPCHNVLALGVSPNDRIVMQARIEGYEMCLNNLGAFSQPLKLPERLEASFEPPTQTK